MHEQGMISARADDPHFDLCFRIPAGKAIDDVQPFAAAEMLERDALVFLERLFGQRDVDLAPPHIVLARGLFDDPLVFRTATLFLARVGRDRTRRNNHSAIIVQCLFVKSSRCGVAKDVGNLDAVISKTYRKTHGGPGERVIEKKTYRPFGQMAYHITRETRA